MVTTTIIAMLCMAYLFTGWLSLQVAKRQVLRELVNDPESSKRVLEAN
ncbi:hypothetical protein [Myxosarcina sp. GI1(2024)]